MVVTPAATPASSVVPSATSSPAVSGPSIAAASPSPAATAQPSPTVSPVAEVTETLRNSDLELHLTNRGGGIASAVLLHHRAEGDQRVILNSAEHPPIGAIVSDPKTPNFPEFKLQREGETVLAEAVMPEQVVVRKRFAFSAEIQKKDNYVAQLDIEFRNNGAAAYTNPGYFVELGAASPAHPKDYPSFTRLVWYQNNKVKGVDVSWFAGSGGFLGIGARGSQPFYQENVPGTDWTAVTNQFFATLITPLSAKPTSVWARQFDVTTWPEFKVNGIEGAMGMPGFTVEPGGTYVAQYQIYVGPKLYHRLATLKHNEAEVMEFGFFKIICQALLNALNTLHSFLGSYAIAIFALTVIVKAILWPLQNKATRSARQMAALSPKMQELREKYKDDPTRMNQELMKLYKDYGINPVGGCLPMLIQIPIFFGLFTMLQRAVELRNSNFLWIDDLAQPDTVARLALLGFSIPINVLPLIMAATSFWMMAITPKSGDPTQQRILMFTPIIFIVFCYNFAAALALYYTTQNLLTVLQLYINRRQPMPVLQKVDRSAKGKRR